MQLQPEEAARLFVMNYFPTCSIALLAGSSASGEATDSSDLDIIVFEDTLPNAYRESFFEFGWRVEAFIHNRVSYREYFESDKKRGRPTLAHMCMEGCVLRDDGTFHLIKQEAKEIIEQGPEPLTIEDIDAARYFLGDLLDDFIDAKSYGEAIFSLHILAIQVAEFILKANRRWLGSGKGLYRSLHNFDESLCESFLVALDSFYKSGEKQPIKQFFETTLEPYGGPLFEGFSMGKV